MYHYPDLDSASVVSDLMVEANFQLIRSTTQTWGVTIHQCGISPLVSQTSFCRETSGGVTKCWLQFQANNNWFHYKIASEKWESQNVDCNLRLTIGAKKYEIAACITNKWGAMASAGSYRLNLENCTLFFLSLRPSTTISTILVYVVWMQNPAASHTSLYLGYYHPKPPDYSLSWVINKGLYLRR